MKLLFKQLGTQNASLGSLICQTNDLRVDLYFVTVLLALHESSNKHLTIPSKHYILPRWGTVEAQTTPVRVA